LGVAPWNATVERLYHVVKREDPDGLVTYVNYPSTEYLRLPFVDLFCFNVYLETPEALETYLARLQNLAGTHPVFMAEIGLDSRRNGLAQQAETLDWQIRCLNLDDLLTDRPGLIGNRVRRQFELEEPLEYRVALRCLDAFLWGSIDIAPLVQTFLLLFS
jgi:hypothetical protein